MGRLGAIMMVTIATIMVACASTPAPTPSIAAELGDQVKVEGTWASSSGGAADVFFIVSNDGARADRLVGVSSPIARRAVLRDGSTVIGSLSVPAGSQVSFDGSRYTLLLTGIRRTLGSGEAIRVNLTFAYAGSVTFDAGVR